MSEPVKLWQMLNMAPGIAAVGSKCAIANATAKPEFCIPTSIDIVRQTAFDLPVIAAPI